MFLLFDLIGDLMILGIFVVLILVLLRRVCYTMGLTLLVVMLVVGGGFVAPFGLLIVRGFCRVDSVLAVTCFPEVFQGWFVDF